MRRSIAHIALLLSVLCGAAVSCGKPAEEEPKVVTSLAAKETQFGAAEGSAFLSVGAGGAWTINVSYSDATGNWAAVSPAQGNGSTNSVIFSFGANESTESRSVTLTLTVENGVPATLTLTQKGKENMPGGKMSGYGFDTTNVGWLELPATIADDGNEWFAHDMMGGDYFSKSGQQRNYSFYWDYKEHLSHWVAYPLNSSLYGSNSFEYLWGFDPLLPASLQPDITSHSYGGIAFGGGNWNRGHQLPRADRQTSQAAVASTCYPTNMTPQDGTFNAGIWALLESKVRGYAPKSGTDTLYVVTGCVLEGSTTFTGTSSGFAVKVPSAYFKALLRSSTTQGFGGYMACGFYLPHSPSLKKENLMDYILSIDDLEKKTGFTFFVNLPAKVGEENARKIKSQEPVSWWK